MVMKKNQLFLQSINLKGRIMLGLFFIYFLGKKFYQLAETHEQNKWLFAIVGILSYYISGFIFGALLLIVGEFMSSGFIDTLSEGIINIIVIPVGLLSCWGLYYLLERKWKNAIKVKVSSIDEIGSVPEE